MTCCNEGTVQWQEDGSAYALSRIVRKNVSHNLVPIQQSDLSSIIRNVVKVVDSSIIAGPTTLTIANVILNALSTGDIWTADSVGFNFIDTIPPASFPEGGVEYQVEYKFTLTTGEVFWLTFTGEAIPVLSS